MNKDEGEHGKERTAKVYRRIRVSLVAQIPPMPDASIRAFLRPTKSRSPQFAETGQEMEIFIPAVEKRSAIDAITRLIAFLLPMAHAVARALSLSISFHLLLPSAHCLPALYPPSFHFLFLPLAQPQYVCLPIPHPSYETHKSPISFYFSLSLSLSLSLLPTFTPLYILLDTQDALPLHGHLRPLPSLGPFLLVPSHLRAIRRSGAPDGSRGNTAYRRSYSAQSF